MRVFETESIWDSQNGQWLENFYVDSNEVSYEEWCDLQDLEMEECEEDECDDCCECGYCDDDTIQEEARIISECLDFVFDDEESYLCCKINKIINLAYLFKNIGQQDAKDILRDFINKA